MRFLNVMYLLTLTVAFDLVAASPSSNSPLLYPRALGVCPDIYTPPTFEKFVLGRQVRQHDEGSISLDRAWYDEALFS